MSVLAHDRNCHWPKRALRWLLTLAASAVVVSPPLYGSDEKLESATNAVGSDSKPTEGFVDSGKVRLQYVDWGGQGRVVLFLAGFGDDAHVFETFAPMFRAKFHPMGLTRRGFGSSDKPLDGYDVTTRAHDIAAFLDAMKIDRVDLVGHSMSGDEMTVFASLYPDRVGRLVYMDAAYDHSDALELMLADPGTPPLYERMILEAQHSPRADSVKVPDMPAPPRWNVLVETIRGMSAYHIDYSGVRAPTLALYANPGHYAGIEPGTPETERLKMERWWSEHQRPSNLANIRKFKREARRGKVIELQGATHYMFLGATQLKVFKEISAFLSQPDM